MRKTVIGTMVVAEFIIGAGAMTTANACPVPKCPATAKYCINPNTPKSHCEPNFPELRTLSSAFEVEIEGKTFVIGPKDQVKITAPK